MFRRIPFWLFMPLLLTSTTTLLPAQKSSQREIINNDDRVSTVVNSAARDFFSKTPQAVGLSIGVVQRGKTYFFHYGTVGKGKARPATDKTLYPIASVTKTFTGILLARAVLEGKVQLDDDVRKYLDGQYPNLEYAGVPIRLKDLLDHQSGLPFFLPDRPESSPDFESNVIPWSTRIATIEETYTRDNFFRDLHSVKLQASPGTKFQYSNSSAMLMGYILERLYGTPYEALLRRNIFDPLQMHSSTISRNASQVAATATGYDEKGVVMPVVPDAMQAAGAIKSSTADMLKYAAWNLAEEDDAVKLSHKPVFTSGSYAAGLNWQEMRANDRRVLWQEGNISGFNSLCIVEPELKLGLVIFANEEDPASAHGQTILANKVLQELDAQSVLLP